jgi:hypothetical protein
MPVTGGPLVRVTHDPGFVPIEPPDGHDLYYVTAAHRPSALRRVPADGGTPVKVLDGVLFGNFDVVDGGIYYLERVSTTIAPSLGMAGYGLSVSRDGRSIFFARVDSAIDELMLVDDFR